jgi:hypothetical protein
MKPLVRGPVSASGNEGYDLALEFTIRWGETSDLVFSEQSLLYRSGQTFAYRVMAHRTSDYVCLVVIHDNQATLYLDEHSLTGVPQEYSICIRYKHRHGRLLGGREQIWSEPVRIAVKVIRKPSNQGAAANRRAAGQSDGSGNLSAILAADRPFPAAVAERGR